MTAITPDYSAPAEEARTPVPLVVLMALTALAVPAQAAASWLRLHGSFDTLFWHAGVGVLHAAIIAGIPALGIMAFLELGPSGGNAAAVARFLRFSLYAALLTAITTAGLEADHIRSSAWLPGVLWLVRSLAVVSLPVATFFYLKVSAAAVARYGKSFTLQMGDAQMLAVSRDGAIVVLLMVVALVGVLFHAALPSMHTFGWKFLVTSDWRPVSLPGGPKLDAEGNAVRDPDTGETVMNPEIPPSFGALPVIYGTIVSSAIALVFAVPLSFGAALFLIRVAPKVLVPPVSFLIEFLAAIPSIAYGLWGLFVLAPFLQQHFEPLFQHAYERLPAPGWVMLGLMVLTPFAGMALGYLFLRYLAKSMGKAAINVILALVLIVTMLAFFGAVRLAYAGVQPLPGLERSLDAHVHGRPSLGWLFNDTVEEDGKLVQRPVALTGNDMLCGGLILAIMIIPIITAISRDVLRAVPGAQVEGTAALGATWWQSSKEMLKYSRSALFGAVMLGLARAAGETMAVTMVIGNNPQIKFSPFMAAQTMASLLANQFAEADRGAHISALFEVALILLLMSLTFNIVARYLVVGKGSRTAAAH